MSKRSKPEDAPPPPSQTTPEEEGPERFNPALLTQPAGVRLRYFEKDCTIEHAYLQQACEAILRVICSPGEEPSLNRLGTMVLVIGPMRVGKTTLISLLQQQLLLRTQERI